VIFRRKRPASTRARQRVQVGRELSARYFKRLDRFLAARARARLKGEEESLRVPISLIPNYSGSDLGFHGFGSLFPFSLRRARARAPKNLVNRLSLRVKTRARAHARLGREIDAGLQKT
jgi:hypothetical protein